MFKTLLKLSFCLLSFSSLIAYPSGNESRSNDIRNQYEYNLYDQNRDQNLSQENPNNSAYSNNNEYMYRDNNYNNQAPFHSDGPQPNVNSPGYQRLETENLYENPRALTDSPQ